MKLMLFFAPIALLFTTSTNALSKTAAPPQMKKSEIDSILKKSDMSRGYIPVGIAYPFEILVRDEYGGVATKKYRLESVGDAAQAKTLENGVPTGRSIVINGDFVWLIRENGKKATPVSVQEKLTGVASVGDIMSNYLSRNYTVKSNQVSADGKSVSIQLDSNSRLASYGSVHGTFDKQTSLLIQASFFSLSKMPVKTVVFEYDQTAKIQGNTIPFLSKMKFYEGGKVTETTSAEAVFGKVEVTNKSKDTYLLKNVLSNSETKPIE